MKIHAFYLLPIAGCLLVGAMTATKNELAALDRERLLSMLDDALLRRSTDETTVILKDLGKFARENLQVGTDGVTRRALLSFHLRIYSTLVAHLDPSHDPSQRFSITATPPEGVPISGMDPNHVRDPELRGKYEEALRDHSKRMRHFRMQKAIPEQLSIQRFHIKSILVQYYGVSEHERQEVRDTLEEFIRDVAARSELLAALGIEEESAKDP